MSYLLPLLMGLVLGFSAHRGGICTVQGVAEVLTTRRANRRRRMGRCALKARGETVYWNAWGGDERTNAFIDWVDGEMQARYGVKVRQVKLSDTAEAVTRVLAEKTAARDKDGSVDLIWINGPNFCR